MRSYFSLVSVFRKAMKMDKPTEKSQKVKVALLGFIAIFFVMIPVAAGCGIFVNLITGSLSEVGKESIGIELILGFISLFTMVFALNVIFNEFYFSNDIEYLLPLPLRASQITGAKFTTAFLSENFMQFLLVLTSIIGFGLAYDMSFLQWITAIIGGFLLPVIPMVYCAIISLLLMSFTRIIKSRDTIRTMSVIVTFIILIALVLSLGSLRNLDFDNYINSVAEGKDAFAAIMRYIFPHIGFLIEAFAGGSVLGFLKYLGINILWIAVFLVLSELLYLRGMTGLNSAKVKESRKGYEKLLDKCKMKSVERAYFSKEMKMLVRTPVYFSNCVAISFIWPIFLYVVVRVMNINYSLTELHNMYVENNSDFAVIMLIFVVGISIIMTAMNSLGSNAFSREGKNFSFIKYIPVSYKKQWNIKAAVSIVISTLSIYIYVLIFGIAIRIPVLHMLIYFVLTVLSCGIITYMGMLLDSMRPKLMWDDELSALRENNNTFFNMAVSILIAGVLCGGGALLHYMAGLEFVAIAAIILGVTVCLIIYFYIRSMTQGIKNVISLEEL